MSRVYLEVRRDGSPPAIDIDGLAARLADPDAGAERPEVSRQEGLLRALLEPRATVARSDGGLLLGHAASLPAGWDRPGGPRPVGGYALVRHDGAAVEAVADAVGSRSLWYAVEGDRLIVSSSQRAVAAALGSFEPDGRCAAWMLTAGTPGPGFGWDRRVSMLPAGATLRLDRRAWRLSVQVPGRAFEPGGGSDEEHAERLLAALRAAVGGLDLSDSRWGLLLSGGVDSRLVLGLLEEGRRPRAFTTGVPASRAWADADPQIAAGVAAARGVVHEFLPLEATGPERWLPRFAALGEGRCDHVSGYVDAFATGRMLRAAGVEAVVRGDEGFGKRWVASEADARLNVACPRADDYANLPGLLALGLGEPERPAWLDRRAGETLEQFRDRLCHAYRLPTVLAALASLREPHAELFWPLAAGPVVEAVHRLPDRLRTGKRAARAAFAEVSCGVPLATRDPHPSRAAVLADPAARAVLAGRLRRPDAAEALPAELLARVAAGLERPSRAASRLTGLKRRVARTAAGKRLLGLVKTRVRRPSLSSGLLGLRAYLVVETAAVLRADAAWGCRSARGRPRRAAAPAAGAGG